jgi:hypothetical protein
MRLATLTRRGKRAKFIHKQPYGSIRIMMKSPIKSLLNFSSFIGFHQQNHGQTIKEIQETEGSFLIHVIQ